MFIEHEIYPAATAYSELCLICFCHQCMGLNNGIEQWAFITQFLLPISISVSISCFP